jgi:hypothetical protein
VLLATFCSLELVRAEMPARFYLDLNRPPPKAGEETERTIRFFSTMCHTNLVQGRESVTNSVRFVELQGREKILNWDVSNDLSKVEMVVQRFVEGDGRQTNELVKRGTHLSGTSILGESFFESKDGVIPPEADQQLNGLYDIRPHDFNEFAHTKVPQPVSIGKTWEIPPPTNLLAMAGILGPSFTNDVKATGRLIGTTNLFGFDCCHLRLHLAYSGMPGFLRQIVAGGPPTEMNIRVGLTADLFVPLDASRGILMKNYRVNISSPGEITVGGKKIKTSGGQSTMNLDSEFRPLSQP